MQWQGNSYSPSVRSKMPLRPTTIVPTSKNIVNIYLFRINFNLKTQMLPSIKRVELLPQGYGKSC